MKKNFILIFLVLISFQCTKKSDYYFLKKTIPKKSKIAVLINGANEIKNAAFTEFLQAGYDVKAVNATDFYTLDDIFDIKTFKKVSFIGNLKSKNTKATASLLDKMFDNIYKLHIYNFENSKVSILQQLKQKWNLEYIVLLEMKNWEEGYSWVRVIELQNMELVYVHNYPPGKLDSYQSILRNIIKVMQSKPSMKKLSLK